MTPQEFRDWRKRLGWSQQQAAAALDKGLSNIQAYERGARKTGGPAYPIPRAVALACCELARRVPAVAGSNAVLTADLPEGTDARRQALLARFVDVLNRAPDSALDRVDTRLAVLADIVGPKGE